MEEPTIRPVLRKYRFPSEHRSQAALGVRPYICTYDECDKSYSMLSHLRRHELSHEGDVKCTEENCKKTFKNKFYLKKHVDLVHKKKKPKKYKCSECGEEFNKHNWLTRHQYKHSGVKPYVCSKEGCDKRFLTPSKLKRHMKMHEGYPCTKENCKVVLSTWTLYRKHLAQSHPTLYTCQYCKKSFIRPCQLKEHKEIHQFEREVIPCPKPNCSRYYTSQHVLNDHIKSCHDKRPFVCPVEHCYRAFKTEEDLNAHHVLHSGRTRKKKNKRPSFSARLAGLAPKKWQTELLKVTTTVDKIESADESSRTTVDKIESADESSRTTVDKIESADESSRTTVDKIESADESSRTTVDKIESADESSRTTVDKIESADESSRTTVDKIEMADESFKTTVDKIESADESSRTTVDKIESADESSRTTVDKIESADESSRTTVDKIESADESFKTTVDKIESADESSRTD